MEEPSVLDYLKAKLMPWRGSDIHFSTSEPTQKEAVGELITPESSPTGQIEDSAAFED